MEDAGAGVSNLPSEDLGPRMLISIWLLVGLSFIFLALRIFCKFKGRRGLWWDDWILTLSWLSLLVSVVLVTFSVRLGLGKHVYEVPVQNFATMGLIGNFTGTFSILAAVWSKTAFALTLLRLMKDWMRWVLYFIIISMNIAMDLNAIFLWVRCSPSAKTWNPMVDGTCWEPHVYPTYGMFAAGYSAAMDFVLALLPWRIIWGLQMKKKEKVGVALAMSMGIFAGATAVVKTVEIPSLASGDFTYASAGLVIWGAAESAVTIMAASIPVLRVLFNEVKARSQRYYYGYGASGAGAGALSSRGVEKDAATGSSQSDNRSRLGSSRIGGAGGGKPFNSTAIVSVDRSRFSDAGPLSMYPPISSDQSRAGDGFILQDVEGKIVRTNEVEVAYHDKGDSLSVKRS